jgi:glycolate oxidase FAD binding subunit
MMPATNEPSTEAYAIGERTPRVVVRPNSPDEVADVLGKANRERAAVVPWGAGTKQRMGNTPRKYDVALDLTALDQVLEYEPADLVVTVQAGIPIRELQRTLEEAGQFLALDPPFAEQSTLGGTLATAISGPSRLLYGTARDVVLGLRVATPEGTLVKSGGKVVKNVVGYDLNKLHIGGMGTAGVMVEATLKVHPMPAAEKTVRAVFESLDAACAAAGQVSRSALYPRAVDLERRGPSGAWQVLVWAAGSPAAVERQVRDVTSWCTQMSATRVEPLDGEAHRSAWSAVRAFGREPNGEASLVRLTCLPSQIPALISAVERAAGGQPPAVVRAGNGVAYIQLPSSDAGMLVQVGRIAVEMGGSAVIEDAPPSVKAALDVWDPSGLAVTKRDDYALMHTIKRQFDPYSTLNPGRYVAGI